MKKYRIQAEKIDGKTFDKVCHSANISSLVKLLGSYGWVVQSYHEVTGDLGDSTVHVSTHN